MPGSGSSRGFGIQRGGICVVPRSEVEWDGNVKSGEDQMMWLNKGWHFEPSLAE